MRSSLNRTDGVKSSDGRQDLSLRLAGRAVSLCLLFLVAFVIVVLCPHPSLAAQRFADFSRFPQDAARYITGDPDAAIISEDAAARFVDDYFAHYFSPWLGYPGAQDGIDLSGIAAYQKKAAQKDYFTANGKAFPKKAAQTLLANAAIDPTRAPRPGIALDAADMRVLPTASPLYPSAASALGARGLLKQDMMQHSTIRPGEPLAIYSASRDGAWLFVSSSAVSGWVRASRVAPCDDEFIEDYLSRLFWITTSDNLRLRGESGGTSSNIKMGTLIPRDGDYLLLPRRNGPNAALSRFLPKEDCAAPFPLPFTSRNAARAVNELLGEPYGWGGLNGWRDCSAMTRDYAALFGIWLPRNSASQAKKGTVILLSDVSTRERERVVMEKAVPFASLVHLPGHIALYVGEWNGKPAVAHNIWGVGVTDKHGRPARAVVGRAVISGLRLGEELPNRAKSGLLLDRVDSITNLTD